MKARERCFQEGVSAGSVAAPRPSDVRREKLDRAMGVVEKNRWG